MKLQNPDRKTLRESSRLASDSMDGLKCDDEGGGGDKVRKIEVSGGNISLVVDFSGSLTGFNSDNNGGCSNENLVKGNNGFREDETQEFLVGNLVWVMNRYKKWWPGEVVGFKADANESFMVRFIGQSHLVSWFASSKLKPFKESFEQVVNQANDIRLFRCCRKSYVLVGKLDMTCSCIADGKWNSISPNGKNRKNKPLILREFLVDRLQPKEFVTQLKSIANCVLNAGTLVEATVMESRLSAFCTFFGHKQIPMGQLVEKVSLLR